MICGSRSFVMKQLTFCFMPSEPSSWIPERARESSKGESDESSSDFLIARDEFEDLSSRPPYSKTKIVAFAERLGIAPGIVVGRLQHERILTGLHQVIVVQPA